MNVYKLIRRGLYHDLDCEDFVVARSEEIDFIVIGVMDGSTMGTESSFSSALLGKAIRYNAKKMAYRNLSIKNPEKVGDLKIFRSLFCGIMDDVKKVKAQLDLGRFEMLSTLLLGLVNCQTNEITYTVIGDGVVVIDGEVENYEAKEAPDYVEYHLANSTVEWLNSLSVQTRNFEDVSFSTDGIWTFQKQGEMEDRNSKDVEILKRILIDPIESENENALRNRVEQVIKDTAMEHTDDLGIVRIVKN